MSIETLKDDAKAVGDQLDAMNSALTTAPELCDFMKNNLIPLQQSIVAELAEMDDTVRDVYEGADDILQPETGELLAAVVVGAMGIIAQLKAKLDKGNIADRKALAAIKEWEAIAKEAAATIEEITIPDDEEDEAAEVEEDDEDEEDEDEDEIEKTVPDLEDKGAK